MSATWHIEGKMPNLNIISTFFSMKPVQINLNLKVLRNQRKQPILEKKFKIYKHKQATSKKKEPVSTTQFISMNSKILRMWPHNEAEF
jgi:hypothetical protein